MSIHSHIFLYILIRYVRMCGNLYLIPISQSHNHHQVSTVWVLWYHIHLHHYWLGRYMFWARLIDLVSSLAVSLFQFFPLAPFYLCSVFIFLCSLLLFRFPVFFIHAPFQKFPMLHPLFTRLPAPCFGIVPNADSLRMY